MSVFCFGVFSSVAEEASFDPGEKLKWIESANPEADAKKAISEKDYRLLAIHGFVLMIPGVNKEDWIEYEQIYGVFPIEGTSDALINEEHARLQNLAFEYGARYNKVILNY